MSHYIIAVDPGESTGVAMIKTDDGTLALADQGEPEHMLALVETMIKHLLDHANEVDVCVERYVSMTGRARTHQPTAQQVIGSLASICRKHMVSLRQQSPADAWACADNHKLRALGWYQRGKDVDQPDANDANMAVRHALLYLSRTRAKMFEQLVGTPAN